jgi:hypothetical protein
MVRRSNRARSQKQPAGEPIEVILLNPDGTPLGTSADRGPGGLGPEDEPRPDIGATVAAGIRQLGRTTAAPGHRAGGTSDRVTRQGCDEEVVTPVHVSPDVAAVTMADRRFFSHSQSGLRVDTTSLKVDRYGLRWRATLRTGQIATRSANLRLYSSPSRNITVLELIPDARRLIRTRSFVRRGVPAVAELAARLGRLSATAGRDQALSSPTECSAPR